MKITQAQTLALFIAGAGASVTAAFVQQHGIRVFPESRVAELAAIIVR
jgi:hypothetical protein